jgi:hypothetical protein
MGRERRTDPGRAVQVHVSAEDRLLIEERANATALSLSAYLRATGLGQVSRRRADYEAVLTLAQMNGELIELAGAFRVAAVAHPARVAGILDRIDALQARMAEAAARL